VLFGGSALPLEVLERARAAFLLRLRERATSEGIDPFRCLSMDTGQYAEIKSTVAR
jgi:hypothetical protein